jgi:hypothetical protein
MVVLFMVVDLYDEAKLDFLLKHQGPGTDYKRVCGETGAARKKMLG